MNQLNEFERQRDAHDIDLAQVEQFLQEQGYSNIQLTQPWRHVTGVAEKDGKKYFFKMASSEGIEPKARNEYLWNKILNERHIQMPIKIPNVYEQGEWQGLFWFMSDFVDGQLLVERSTAKGIDELEHYFEPIAQTAEDIMNLPADLELLNNSSLPLEERKQRFFEHIKHWMSQIPQDVSRLYDFIETNADAYLPGTSHGDFVPWHMIKDAAGQLTLVDGEHSKTGNFKFYDVAYFYHRIFTGPKRPDLADKFLQTYLAIHPMTPQEKTCFMVVLAQRTIGGYFDANVDHVDTAIHDELANKVLGGQIL